MKSMIMHTQTRFIPVKPGYTVWTAAYKKPSAGKLKWLIASYPDNTDEATIAKDFDIKALETIGSEYKRYAGPLVDKSNKF